MCFFISCTAVTFGFQHASYTYTENSVRYDQLPIIESSHVALPVILQVSEGEMAKFKQAQPCLSTSDCIVGTILSDMYIHYILYIIFKMRLFQLEALKFQWEFLTVLHYQGLFRCVLSISWSDTVLSRL